MTRSVDSHKNWAIPPTQKYKRAKENMKTELGDEVKLNAYQ